MGRGVECKSCGASTPLPDDLRVPSFSCAFCHQTLRTVDYAGEQTRAAAEMNAFFQRAVDRPHDLGTAPKLVTANRDATRPSRCRRCGAEISVSLDLRVHQVQCAACGHTDAVSAHISDAERMQLDMQRQVEGNDAYRRLIAEGVACERCGGKNDVPSDGAVQIVCRFCAQPILLRDHVDEDALARRQLRNAALAMRDGLQAKQKATDKRVAIIILALVAAVVVVGVVAALAFAR